MLLHTSGESIELAGYGHGVDPQDKGAGKATTYALKNTLLYTFLTPVGKIDDSDTEHSQDKPVPTSKPKVKESLSDDRFNNALSLIKKGEYKKENLSSFNLTKEQENQLNNL